MKQFIKALVRDGDCFHYTCSTFLRVSDEKKKAGIFDGPQIRSLLKDKHFMARMTAVEARAWVAFTNVVQNEHQTALPTQSLGQVFRQP